MSTTNRQATGVNEQATLRGTQDRSKDDRATPAARRAPAPVVLPPLSTPCFGRSELFDSVEFADHHEARSLCADCPLLGACSRLLEDVLRSSKSGCGPEGTWAGRGFNIGRKPGRPRKLSDHQIRLAHNAYNRGERLPWVIEGERQYQRNRNRRRRATEVA